jgi:LysM repeat protein/TolA-binding protein
LRTNWLFLGLAGAPKLISALADPEQAQAVENQAQNAEVTEENGVAHREPKTNQNHASDNISHICQLNSTSYASIRQNPDSPHFTLPPSSDLSYARNMSRVPGWLVIAVLGLCLVGCGDAPQPQNDEQNPHFQRARDLVNLQDYKGAVTEFEKVLETSPQSAATHYELGWICENDKIRDYATAIYHYQKHLQLKPDSERAAQVHERIQACRRELANGEFPLPTSQNLQKEVDRLTAENLVLKQQAETLKTQLANAQLALTNYAMALANARKGSPTQVASGNPAAPDVTPLPKIPRTYHIQDGDTISGIASRFKLKTSVILAANPKVKPERLRVGQSINLPVQ